MDLIDRIQTLFVQHGNQAYEGRRRESVTALAHALQCAQLAEWAQAPASLVVASLLHDVGHFVDRPEPSDAVDDVHEMRAVPFLSEAFGPAVVEPVRLHVQAKRYLVAVEPRYLAGLSAASVHSLFLQGGPMCRDEVLLFEGLPFAEQAVALRRWDDLAKKPGGRVPPLSHYLSLMRDVMATAPRQGARRKTDATPA